jgi:protein-S-isoprenylcysteine O-methyltransferase Ste14
VACSCLSGGCDARRRPRLGSRAAKPKDAGTDESRVTAGLLFLITFAVAGFSVGHCRQAFNTPPPIRHLALGVFLLSGAFQTGAMMVNPFFSPVVRLQAERGHRVIADGPYRFMRHPGYLAMMISLPASALSIGSWLALIPASCFVLRSFPRRTRTPVESVRIVPLWLSCPIGSPPGLASPNEIHGIWFSPRWANLDDRWWANLEYRNQLSGERRKAAQERRMGEHRMNARLLRLNI